MSHIGKKPIELPAGVTAVLRGRVLQVSGPKGMLERAIPQDIDLVIGERLITAKPRRESRRSRALWGLYRALVAGMVEGVSRGFEKKLEIEGIGYRANLDGTTLQFSLGFSHPVRVRAPSGITFKVEKNIITVAGVDKELVGDTAARIRGLRPPEPYKGKGLRYAGEVIRRKAGKKAVTAAA